MSVMVLRVVVSDAAKTAIKPSVSEFRSLSISQYSNLRSTMREIVKAISQSCTRRVLWCGRAPNIELWELLRVRREFALPGKCFNSFGCRFECKRTRFSVAASISWTTSRPPSTTQQRSQCRPRREEICAGIELNCNFLDKAHSRAKWFHHATPRAATPWLIRSHSPSILN